MKTRAIVVAFILALLAILANQNLAYAAPSGCAMLPSSIAQQISASEPWYCPINQQLYEQWSSDLPIACAAILLAFAIAALIVMVGIALKSDKIRNFGVGEVYEAVATTMIVAAFLYVSAVMFGIIPALIVGSINPFPTAFNLITSTIQQIEQVYSNYFSQYMYYKFIYSVSPQIVFKPGLDLSSELLMFPFRVPLMIYVIAPLESLADLLSDGIALLWAEYYLLVFFSVAAIPAFLIPGIVFRAIFPTRALGGMLIALAIAFYMVMPTLFAVAYYFTYPGMSHEFEAIAAQSTRFATGAAVAGITPTSPMVLQLQSTLQNTQSALSSFWLLILFYPILIAAITYAFVTQVANFIGGAAQTGGRMRGFI